MDMKIKSLWRERSKWLCKNYDGRIVFISTCSVYGFNDKLLDEESELNPLSLYAWTKLNSERYLDGKNAIIFRLGTVYGLGDIFSRLRMDLVVNILTAHAQKLNKITVFGGEQHRPLIHVKDIALAIEKIVDKDITGVFNIHSLNTTVINIAAAKSPNPNGTLYCINVGSVMYILFALRSMDSIVFGAASSSMTKRTEMPPILSMYIILYYCL